MSIQAEMSELKGLKLELKAINKRSKMIRTRIKKIEAIVANYIQEKNLPGIKHNGVAVRVQKKMKRANKPNKQRDRDAMEILKEYGIRNPEKALKKIMDARKGEEKEINKLKIDKIKNK